MKVEHSIGPQAAEPVDLSEGGRDGPVRVLQVLPELGPQGGVERGTVDVAAAVVGAGGEALVACQAGLLVHELARAGGRHADLPLASKNPYRIWRNGARLADLIRREGIDIVHARSRAPAWSAWRACQITGTPFVTTFHGTYGTGTALKRRYNSVMTRGEPIIAISRFIAEHLHRVYGVPLRRIRIIHRGLDAGRLDPDKVSAERVIQLARKLRVDDGHPIVCLPGRLTRWKGQLVLVEAIARLGRSDLRCLLVGSDQGRTGYRAELERRIAALNLGGVVRIVDEGGDMPALYKLSDVVVSASVEPEAFGRIAVEAQAMERLLIATDHGGARETVRPGETGWLVPPDDPDALAAAIDAALRLDVEARQAMGRRAGAHARANFSRDAMCARTLAVYREVLARRQATR